MRKCACDTCPDQMGCDLEMPCMNYFDSYYDDDEDNEDDDEDDED